MFSVGKMCSVFKVSRSGFYTWLKHTPSNRSVENQLLEQQIREAFQNSKNSYGSPRITRMLNRKHIPVSRPRVARIMKKVRLRSVVKKKFQVTTDANHKFPIPENKLDRDFKPGTISAVWVSDLTYIKTKQGWL